MKRFLLFGLLVLISIMLNEASVSADSGKDRAEVKSPMEYAFPYPIILIDAGHGGIDGGASFQDIVEKNINLMISQKVYMILRSQGYESALNRTGDYALSDENRWLSIRSRHRRDLAQRKGLTEQVPTAVVISIHANWGRNSSRRGSIVLHQEEGRSALLAGCIQNALNPLFHTNNTIRLGKPFYILNHVDTPAVIVETGFLSNSEDRSMLCNPRAQQDIASAIVAGIIQYLMVT
ncbi:N-acetylmuramoyl-L-alanine amidase [Paenibacillus sediminis]|uniref:N-acetylmuramoyl-L-alanine amidase CwlD n=1 Tax=Paenibacillus sediminis TaxID=664909 RepID=A0ABS4H689_9BACL|nr:N-acetylmuramoyl-L-alanine amidase [Paenibacillus sediminis]MBP1938054.1 N-acetylmuramoyl-L-alanine amidase CwlD [Paenibacillus sediminis]